MEELQRLPGDQLLLSNHPSRIDWMYHWALAIALGRLPKLKIVLKELLDLRVFHLVFINSLACV